jgi:sensor histidine kinase regulating citrate/malate metabolism
MISKQTNTFKFNKVQSLKIKFPFYITILCVLISAVLAFVFTQKNLISLKTEYEKRSNSIALNLSNEIKYGLLTEDTEVISQVILPQLKQPDIIYIVVVNNKGGKISR